MNRLTEILARKRLEVEESKKLRPLSMLKQHPHYNRPRVMLSQALSARGSSGIITEFKRRSPSRGVMDDKAPAALIAEAYQQAGASAISILTDGPDFGCSLEDLSEARYLVDIPILRKDFIIDPYQVTESRAYGADAILLIAALLKPDEVEELGKLAALLNLEVLLEIHHERELDHINPEAVDIVGINCRNLKTMKIDRSVLARMIKYFPKELLLVAESGIQDHREVMELSRLGYRGFLIGDRFMSRVDPPAEARIFIQRLNG